jgi:hypothetical protein
MPTPSQYSARLREVLRVSEPELDTSVGTPVRKMLDAFAEMLGEVSIDNHLMTYAYDIDARSGADLDDFVRLFGYERLPARRATGNVTFSRSTPATVNIFIPAGTQVSTDTAPQVVYATAVAAVLPSGGTEVTIPSVAVAAGPAGNSSASSISILRTSISGITTVTNPTSMTGGVAVEADETLRRRFKRTIFRNMAGTVPMFEGTAFEDPDVTQVNVVGASKIFREQIEIVSGTATSSITGAAYIFGDNVFFGPDIDGGDILTEGAHYTFNEGANPPTIASIDAYSMTGTPDGVYDLAYTYLPQASRNNPAGGITNRVDVYVKGERLVDASEEILFNSAVTFGTSGTYDRTLYERVDESLPVSGNIFTPLRFVPIASIPSQFTAPFTSGQNWVLGTDYWIVHKKGNEGYSSRSVAGIEWKSTANGQAKTVPITQYLTVDYSFNSVPRDVALTLDRWRLVTSDVMVHQARPILLNLHFAVLLQLGASSAVVETELVTALSQHLSQIGFETVVQVSDLLAVGHSVPGIDAIRFLTSTDNGTNYAIQRVNSAGVVQQTYATGGRAIDVHTNDDSVPVLNDVVMVVKAQNTFGAV